MVRLVLTWTAETLTFTGGTGIDTSGSGNAVTFAIDSTVATLTGTQTLTNKTLTSPDVNTPDIDGGTIDGTVIGGTTPAAVSATTVSATGNITVGGTVDGRDVATDGTKLDGIESGATADQTAAEIRTLVDSATDSNVFTDADHTKLDGIEAGATGDQTNAEIRAAVEAATDSNVFTDADHSKLDGIEASADVTDTANVTAAGALMDSELTSEASVKALNQGVATTDSPTFAGVTVNGNVEFDGLSGTGSVTVTDILDQDDMSSNSATALATQQSIKAYVDTTVAATNELVEDTTPQLGGDLDLNGNDITGTGNINNTGTITTDGLTVDGNITNLNYGKTFFTNGIGTNKWQIWNDNGGTDKFQLVDGDGHLVLQAEQSGDISFYEDTGTTAKLFWDASAESLGIGVADPAGLLEVFDVLTVPARNTVSVANQRGLSVYQNQSNGLLDTTLVYGNSASSYLAFGHHNGTSYAERMRIDSSGNVDLYQGNNLTWRYAAGSTIRGSMSIDSADNITFSNTSSNTERMRIDSSGNTTFKTSAGHLSVEALGGGSVKLNSNGSMGMNVASGFSYEIDVGGTEAMRIDSNRNLLVGTTDTVPSNNGASGDAGVAISPDGVFRAARSGNVALDINRMDSDGNIADFRKDGSTVGTIGAYSSRLFIGSGDTGIFFDPTTDDAVKPWNTSTNAGRDAAIDLGDLGTRFKDLYLSGTANLTGTATGATASSSGNKLVVDDTENGISILSSTSGAGYLIFGDSDDNDIGMLIYDHSANALRTYVNAAERMRIDSSGNLLVGKTNNTLSNDGTIIRAGGEILVTNTSDTAGTFNRLSTDGAIIGLYKDGTTVGSIQSRAGVVSTIILDPRSGQGAGLTGAGAGGDTLRHITPTNESGTEVNGKVSLGNSNNGFKDLYLSGGVYLGGTGSANYLDDYEEGTWTPADYSGASLSFTVNYAKYTKIGNLVHVQMYIVFPVTSDTNASKIGNLPFSSEASGFAAGALNSDESTALVIQKNSNSNTFQIKGSGNAAVTNATLSNNFIVSSFTYITAS